MGQEIDMFGWPVRAGRGMRGKPPHVRCLETVNKINMMLAFGWSNDRIAGAMGISLPTLRKYYVSELKRRAIARDAVELKLAERLWGQVELGKVAAIKQFDKLLERNDRMATARQVASDDRPEKKPVPSVRSIPQGKKELAVVAAERTLNNDPDLQPGISGLMN
jgi:hypothetical protein